jgi:methylphosphotriester-DNA--protein-cysteine methyltransferase
MRKFDTLRSGVALIVLLTLCGCQNQNGAVEKNEEAAKESVRFLSEIVDAMESVEDKDSAKSAAAKINKAIDRMEKYLVKAKNLPPISQSENTRLEKKYMSQIKKLNERMEKVAFSAGMKCEEEPDFMKAMERMASVGQKMQQMGN